MTPPLDERELDRLLERLPRERASAGFTRRVLTDLEAPARPSLGRRWALAVALAAAVAVLTLWPRAPEPVAAPQQAETQRLLDQHERLVRELQLLKAQMPAPEAPVLYLGGDEALDLILDLGPVLSGQPAAGMRPATLTGPVQGQPAVANGNRNGGSR